MKTKNTKTYMDDLLIKPEKITILHIDVTKSCECNKNLIYKCVFTCI